MAGQDVSFGGTGAGSQGPCLDRAVPVTRAPNHDTPEKLSLSHRSAAAGRSRGSAAAKPGCRSTSSRPSSGTQAAPSLSPSSRRSLTSIAPRRPREHGRVRPPAVVVDRRLPQHEVGGEQAQFLAHLPQRADRAGSPSCSAPPGVPQVPPWCDQAARCCSSSSQPSPPSRWTSSPAAPARPQCRWPRAQNVHPSVEAATAPVNLSHSVPVDGIQVLLPADCCALPPRVSRAQRSRNTAPTTSEVRPHDHDDDHERAARAGRHRTRHQRLVRGHPGAR